MDYSPSLGHGYGTHRVFRAADLEGRVAEDRGYHEVKPFVAPLILGKIHQPLLESTRFALGTTTPLLVGVGREGDTVMAKQGVSDCD